MNAYEEHAAGLAELQNETPLTFTWRGAARKVLPGGAQRAKEIKPGGFAPEADLSLVCLVSELGYSTTETLVAALLKSQLTYQGHIYRVESVTVAPGELQVTIRASDLNKGV